MQKKGRAYETRVLRQVDRLCGATQSWPRQWIGFEDPPGRFRAAQPDLFALISGTLVIVEIKLTRCLEGFWQIERLYAPLLSQLFPWPIAGVVVFRNPGPGYIPHAPEVRTLREALNARPGFVSEYHCLV